MFSLMYEYKSCMPMGVQLKKDMERRRQRVGIAMRPLRLLLEAREKPRLWCVAGKIRQSRGAPAV
jgi:hypothetical protein